ncbi:hypothetical protein JCM5350_004979, partial [Sporobolomyces pararoseus]
RYLSNKPRDTIDLFTLSTRIQSTKNSYKNEKGVRGSNENLFGLKLLLRKELNRDTKKEEKEETSHKNDYGPISHAVGKGITKKEIKESENWEILENFSKFTKKVNNVTKEYLKVDTNLIEPSRDREDELATESLPYVPGFDYNSMFGIQEEANGAQAGRTNLQYIAAVPKSLLPFIEQAEKEINEVLNIIKKEEEDDDLPLSPTPVSNDHGFFSGSEVLFKRALDRLNDLNLDLEMIAKDSKPTSSSSPNPKRFIPTFKSPYPSPAPTPTIKLTHPLTSLEGSSAPFQTSHSTSDYVYLVFSMTSLLQFRGLSPLVDQVKDLLFLSYIALARVATNYPYEPKCVLRFPDGSEFEYSEPPQHDGFFYEGLRGEESMRCNEYLTFRTRREVVEKKFQDELEWVRGMGESWMRRSEANEDGGLKCKVGEWDRDRQSWLDSYLEGKAMI